MAAQELASNLEQVVRNAKKALDGFGCKWALVGGLAVSARAEPRFTRDVDLAVAVDGDPQAERLIRILQQQGYRVLTVLEQENSGRLATVRLQPPEAEEHGVILDLLFSSSGIEPEIVRSASSRDLLAELENVSSSAPITRTDDREHG